MENCGTLQLIQPPGSTDNCSNAGGGTGTGGGNTNGSQTRQNGKVKSRLPWWAIALMVTGGLSLFADRRTTVVVKQ